MLHVRSLALLMSLALTPVVGCAMATGDEDGDAPEELDGRESESVLAGVDCSVKHTSTGYKSGSPFTITVVAADGKPIEIATASAYAKMQHAAAKDGVAIRVVSGFRTYSQQDALYKAYLAGKGNLAAKPGYSNHQSGHALDLNTSSSGVYSWLASHGDEYGFKRTVPSEAWHWEYWGPDVGGACTSTAPPPPSGSACHSDTLGRDVPLNTCVQSRYDRKWYQCISGSRWEIRWNVPAACVSEHPL